MAPTVRGAAGRFQRAPGGRGHGAAEKPRFAPYGQRAARAVPPRGRADMSCINCGRKGHAASECRQPKKEKGDRPCFTRSKTWHEAQACPDKGVPAKREVRAIEDIPRRVAAMMVTDSDRFRQVPPRRSGQQLGDYFSSRPAPRCNNNRFRPISL